MTWLHKILKTCNRHGHNLVRHPAKVKVQSNTFREAFADYHAVIEVCSKCGQHGGIELKEKIQGYQSPKVDTQVWDQIKIKGYFTIDIDTYEKIK